jgi:high-affinity Fe2+/Pb2+ permease
MLKALLGYNGNPSLTEMLAYLGYFIVVLWLVWFFNRKPVEKSVTAA